MTSHPIDKTLTPWSALTEDTSLRSKAVRYSLAIEKRDAAKAHLIAMDAALMTVLQVLAKAGAGRFEHTTPEALLTTGSALFGSPGLILAHPQAENELRATLRGMLDGPAFRESRTPGAPPVCSYGQKIVLWESTVQYGGLVSIELGDVRYWCSDIEIDPDTRADEGLTIASVLLAVKVDRPLRRISLAKIRKTG